ncbi:hypothetical protein HG717_15885 [Rhodococcus erythropolis]|uniref:hypothetical protein n=1 Tax=Rhodococcus erythropolis TaxID=1833 RepID=UPI001C9A57D2|nr:hypothetical protein [Rhodococcus erythropolis]MBY6385382.1 hypothetical protein [Rhodococcus erythropolis]
MVASGDFIRAHLRLRRYRGGKGLFDAWFDEQRDEVAHMRGGETALRLGYDSLDPIRGGGREGCCEMDFTCVI